MAGVCFLGDLTVAAGTGVFLARFVGVGGGGEGARFTRFTNRKIRVSGSHSSQRSFQPKFKIFIPKCLNIPIQLESKTRYTEQL